VGANGYEGEPLYFDMSEHWACVNPKCSYGDPDGELYFCVHHVFRGSIQPGDSWSISWIK